MTTPQTPTLSIWLRSLLFFVLYNLIGILHSTASLFVAPFLTYRQRYNFVNLWTRATIWLLRLISGIRVEVVGLENIPANEPIVIIANHQSQWETFYLQLIVKPQATVLKRELLWVPFFGWALALLKPIAINRGERTQALKKVLRQGKERLAEGINVTIFPEGTRQPPNTLGKFNPGGAMLACQAGARVLPMVHNAGHCWPARSMLRFPGTIRLVIGEPISTTNKQAKEVNQEVCDWMYKHLP